MIALQSVEPRLDVMRVRDELTRARSRRLSEHLLPQALHERPDDLEPACLELTALLPSLACPFGRARSRRRHSRGAELALASDDCGLIVVAGLTHFGIHHDRTSFHLRLFAGLIRSSGRDTGTGKDNKGEHGSDAQKIESTREASGHGRPRSWIRG
jgi:hypothetical protein